MDEYTPFSRRPSHRRTGSFTSSAGGRIRSPNLHRASFGSNASDTGTEHSEIVAPVPRRHLTLQRSESQHWLGSPPLSPVSAASGLSRAASPLAYASSSNPNTSRKRHSLSFSSLKEHKPTSNAKRLSQHIYSNVRNFSGASIKSTAEGSEERLGEGTATRRWVRWMHKNGLKEYVIPIVVGGTVLVKWCVGFGGYSGHATPPLHGDLEAQRHWMELTLHLPLSRWYTYDLQYWGLDYPPLTAYVSWACGYVGHFLNPSWFALPSSRGLEDPTLITYLRATVLALELLVWVPAVWWFVRAWLSSRSQRTQHVAFLTLLLHPALILIDNGHFQYNSVMLGLTLLAINSFAQGRDMLGAIFFVGSLGFKQMALYYAPAIGAYLISKCLSLGPKEGTQLFIRLGVVTVFSFIIIFLPWIPPFSSLSFFNSSSPVSEDLFATLPSTGPLGPLLQVIQRIFPFSRGLFEDKVANFWCATNVVIKWRRLFERGVLVKLSTLLTAAGFAPGVVGMVWGGWKVGYTGTRKEEESGQKEVQKNQDDQREKTKDEKSGDRPAPTLSLLPYALLTSSLSFFLFSFQVHEKTILVPLLPLMLLMCGSMGGGGKGEGWEVGAVVSNVAIFSMHPLLFRDSQGLAYISLTALYNLAVGYNPFKKPQSLIQYGTFALHIAMIALHILEALMPPPARLPDLYPVLTVLLSTPVFGFTWLWSIKKGIEVSWTIGGLFGKGNPTAPGQINDPLDKRESVIEGPTDIVDGKIALPTPALETGRQSLVIQSAIEPGVMRFPTVDRSAGLRTRSLGFGQGKRPSAGLHANSDHNGVTRSGSRSSLKAVSREDGSGRWNGDSVEQ